MFFRFTIQGMFDWFAILIFLIQKQDKDAFRLIAESAGKCHTSPGEVMKRLITYSCLYLFIYLSLSSKIFRFCVIIGILTDLASVYSILNQGYLLT